jgi:hypothetical protein
MLAENISHGLLLRKVRVCTPSLHVQLLAFPILLLPQP